MKRICFLVILTAALLSLQAQPMPRLDAGDTIAIVAPSSKVTPEEVAPAVKFLQAQGFSVIVPDDLYEESDGFAGTVSHRTDLLQRFLDRPGIKAILCARGGYGAVSLLDNLDFTQFRKCPKWFCGFSDITALHSHLHVLGFPSLHCAMPVTIREENFDSEYNASMVKALRGDSLRYDFAPNRYNHHGIAVAPVVGGNLSLLYSLLESASSIDTDGKILFIEDVDENIYHIHRLLVALDRAGKLRNLKGLVVGSMRKIRFDDYFADKTVEEVILEVCGKYGYPICFDFPAGHGGKNLALPLGCQALLAVGDGGCSLIFGLTFE